MLIAVSSFGESLRRVLLTAPAEAVYIHHFDPIKQIERSHFKLENYKNRKIRLTLHTRRAYNGDGRIRCSSFANLCGLSPAI